MEAPSLLKFLSFSGIPGPRSQGVRKPLKFEFEKPPLLNLRLKPFLLKLKTKVLLPMILEGGLRPFLKASLIVLSLRKF